MDTVWWYKELNGRRIHQWPNAARELAPADADAEQGAPRRSRRFGLVRSGRISRLMAVQSAYAWKGWGESTRELASVGVHANG